MEETAAEGSQSLPRRRRHLLAPMVQARIQSGIRLEEYRPEIGPHLRPPAIEVRALIRSTRSTGGSRRRSSDRIYRILQNGIRFILLILSRKSSRRINSFYKHFLHYLCFFLLST